MQSTHHRRAGFLALAAAVLGALAVIPTYDELGSLAHDPSDLCFSLVLAAVVAMAGMCVMSRGGNAGALVLAGISASVFASQAADVASRIGEPAGIGPGWFMDKGAFFLLLAATVVAILGLRRTGEVALGMSMAAFTFLTVGFFLVVVYVVGEIIPLGEVTARDSNEVVRFTWGALFDGDDTITRVGHIFAIVLAGGSLLLAGLLKPLRVGVAVLAGWAMAETASLAADAIKLLRPEIIDGTRFTGEIGPGLVARTAALAVTAGVIWAVVRVERRRSIDHAETAPEADDRAHLIAV